MSLLCKNNWNKEEKYRSCWNRDSFQAKSFHRFLVKMNWIDIRIDVVNKHVSDTFLWPQNNTEFKCITSRSKQISFTSSVVWNEIFPAISVARNVTAVSDFWPPNASEGPQREHNACVPANATPSPMVIAEELGRGIQEAVNTCHPLWWTRN